MWKLLLLLTLWSCQKHVKDEAATVLPSLAPCTDTIPNCAQYGANTCTDYKSWATARCSAFCHFCTGAATMPTPAPPCVDTITNCREYGTYICHDTILSKWTREHCLLYCKWCSM